MATTIRLEHLLQQGVPDEPGCSFTVSKESYLALPILPDDFFEKKNLAIEKVYFKEVYRQSKTYRPAIRLYDESEILNIPNINDKQIYYYLLFIEEEGIWVFFKYYDLTTLDESYSSTVEVNIPIIGEIYRPNEEAKKIISKYYTLG